MGIRARSLVILAVWTFIPAVVAAQPPTPATTQPPAPASTPRPAGSTAPAPASGTPAAPAPPATPPRPAEGYGWSSTPAPAAPAQRRSWGPARPAGPTAVLPGFEELGDGMSRLFVELTKQVAVEEKKAAGSITYVLKGAHVNVWNNYHPLVTIHFNTPVWRARLVPRGGDLLFVVELRANVTPTWKITPVRDGLAILQVDFPSGSFLPGDPLDGLHAAQPPATSPTPTPAPAMLPR